MWLLLALGRVKLAPVSYNFSKFWLKKCIGIRLVFSIIVFCKGDEIIKVRIRKLGYNKVIFYF